MEFIPTTISGLYVVVPHLFSDERGTFVKTFSRDVFLLHGLQASFEETFYSVSKQNVLRGFHLQLPPRASEKIVCVTRGKVLDVALDLRKTSETYGMCFSLELNDDNHRVLYLPQGVAHAFYVLSGEATVLYQGSRCFSSEQDGGIRWDSVDFSWPAVSPIISDKDKRLPLLSEFDSPF